MMRSLTFKLTLAFLLIGLTGSILVAVITWRRTQLAFGQFLLDREQQSLVTRLETYYLENGSWTAIDENIIQVVSYLPHDFDSTNKEARRDWMRFTLIDANQTIIYSSMPNMLGQPVSSKELEKAILLQANETNIGWLVPLVPDSRQLGPGSPEGSFLATVNSATLLSALVASLMALSLGGVLAFTITRSLRELTEATVEISRGKLGRQVKVRTQDEIGELAASFNRMSLDLARATQARRQMTADIAHDLRSPLSVISGYAEALNDGKLPGSPEVYDILYQETKHLSRLIDDLRILSLADAGELPLVLQPIKPQVILERVVTRHAVKAQQKAITLIRELPASNETELPEILVDVERMAQVFDNLVLNAFRYTPQNGEISLRAWADGVEGSRLIHFQVKDNGSGISAEDLPYIFDRFYRGDAARQQTGESGLGLAIAKSIVEAHKGTIAVESHPGQGTAFTLTFAVKE